MAIEVSTFIVALYQPADHVRGLAFTVAALRRSLDNPGEELVDSFTKAYNDTLKKFHSFVIKPLFAVSPLLQIVLMCR